VGHGRRGPAGLKVNAMADPDGAGPEAGRDPWGGILGNVRALGALARIARSASLGHAYLFSGPEGTGKLMAALAFARQVNCRCDEAAGPGEGAAEPCESCKALYALSHPEVLILGDANKPRWLKRADLMREMGLEGPGSPVRYAETVLSAFERGYLEEPLPQVEADAVLDGFNIVTDNIFGKGGVPSKECYTPGPVSEAIRRGFEAGDLAREEFVLLRRLYEYPLSVMPYRGSIHIAYITARQDWKNTRPIQSFLSVRSLWGGRKIVVIDDAHKMTPQAQNCLLKTLEEPPADSLLVLVTHDRRRLFPTIVSRCQVVNFDRLTSEEMALAAKALIVGAGGPGAARGPGGDLVAALAENCPGKLLELANMDVAATLGAVREFFTSIGRGSMEGAFALSSATTKDAPRHRKKLQRSVGETLEMVIFWTAEVVRAKHGLASRPWDGEDAAALAAHARRFDEERLLEAARRVEAGLACLAWNVDLGLLLDATLLGAARVLLTP
jgi:DNA polymerase III delta prime subunit